MSKTESRAAIRDTHAGGTHLNFFLKIERNLTERCPFNGKESTFNFTFHVWLTEWFLKRNFTFKESANTTKFELGDGLELIIHKIKLCF